MTNKKNIRKWVSALRSGEYDQTYNTLYRGAAHRHGGDFYPAGHCCLGVLCEVAGVDYYPGAVTPPEAVWLWLGVSQQDTVDGEDLILTESDGVADLTAIGANDRKRLPFTQIADLIEERYL